MANWYTTREAVKSAMEAAAGRTNDRVIDRLIQQVSDSIDQAAAGTRFIPIIETRTLPYSRRWVRGDRLVFDAALWSLTSLKDRGGDRTLTEGTHFTLQPENAGPPYYAAEVLRSQGVAFEGGAQTSQQSFEITGEWSSWRALEAAGTLAAAIADATSTTIQVKDGSKVGVGDTLLIGSEQIFVKDRTSIDLGVNLAAGLDRQDNDETVTIGDPTDNLQEGEIIRVGSERMLVTDVDSAAQVQVSRAHDGTTLAAHLSGADVFVFREYTVERGVNGTTAAAHDDDSAVSRLTVPPRLEEIVIAEVIANFQQQRAGWGRTVGGERQVELSGRGLRELRTRILPSLRRHLMASVGD